jgi:hypothetical protein
MNKILGYDNVSIQIASSEIPIGRSFKQAVMGVLQTD